MLPRRRPRYRAGGGDGSTPVTTVSLSLGQQFPETTIPTNLGKDLHLWTKEDVTTFMHWCGTEFDVSFDVDRFQINGKGLRLLTKADIELRAPSAGDVIHNAIQFIMSTYSSQAARTPPYLKGGPDLEHFESQPWWTSVTLSPAPSVDVAAESLEVNGSTIDRPNSSPKDVEVDQSREFCNLLETPRPGITGNNNDAVGSNKNRLLYNFLRDLLNDPAQQYKDFIMWTNVETQTFKVVHPSGLARLWGIQKNNLSMNYDKMTRSFRHYYRVNVLCKVVGEAHCYQFLTNSESIQNFSPRILNPPVTVTRKSLSSSISSSCSSHNNYENSPSPATLSFKINALNPTTFEDDQLVVNLEPCNFIDYKVPYYEIIYE